MHNKELRLPILAMALALQACMPLSTHKTAAEQEASVEHGIRWVQNAAEFEALALQTYNAAAEDLDRFIADPGWSALPDQSNAANLPIAIIADVDETIVSNVEFQIDLELPFTSRKMDDWNRSHKAKPIPGAVKFVARAQDAGVEVFFVTNRPCEKLAGIENSCPQKSITVQDLREIGIRVDADHVMLSKERPEWKKEKLTRREHVAKTHRVIMLFGDDLGDFIFCTRAKPLAPCTEGATISSRQKATQGFTRYWGEGWYVLPNPMHGSWTTVN